MSLFMRDVPVVHSYSRAWYVAEALAQGFGNHDRAMTAPGAADGDRQVALAFRYILRNQKLQQIVQTAEQLSRRRLLFHELDDRSVSPGLRAQPRHEVRIRQKSHVEDEVGVQRNSVLEAKTDHR